MTTMDEIHQEISKGRSQVGWGLRASRINPAGKVGTLKALQGNSRINPKGKPSEANLKRAQESFRGSVGKGLFKREKARKLSDLKQFKQAGAKEKNIRWAGGKPPKGYVSKGKGPASAMKWWNGVKPGEMAIRQGGGIGAGGRATSRQMAESATSFGGGGGRNVGSALRGPHSSINYTAARAGAKKQGKLAAGRIAQGRAGGQQIGGFHSPEYAANQGWSAKANALESIHKPAGKAPAGMRGPIAGRSNTTKQQATWKQFQ